MRISFFVPRCTPENSHGRYVIELAKRFSVEHTVSVYSGSFWAPLRRTVRCKFVPVPNRPTVARLTALWIASRAITVRRWAQIVHVQGADAPVGNVNTAQFCNAVMRASVGPGTGLYRRFNHAIGAAAESYCLSKPSVKWIIAISSQVKADIEREYGVDPKKVVVIHHGVDTDAFHPENRVSQRTHTRERLGLGPDEFVVVFVGGDYQRKGLITLLEAVRRVPVAVKVLAVGVQGDAALDQTVRQKGLSKAVTFIRTTENIEPYYSAADCFVLPTLYDTFSMATLEAMAAGLPVVVSRAAGVSELLTPDKDSFLLEDPKDSKTLAAYLELLACDGALRTRIGVEARRTAEQHSWDEVARRTLAMYYEIVRTS